MSFGNKEIQAIISSLTWHRHSEGLFHSTMHKGNPTNKGNQSWQKHPRPDPPRSSSCLISRERNGVISGSAILNTIRRLCNSRKNICVIPGQFDPACSETSRAELPDGIRSIYQLSCFLLPVLQERGYKGSERTLRNYLHLHPRVKAKFEKANIKRL